jgi:lipopolysaccharide export system permease protein
MRDRIKIIDRYLGLSTLQGFALVLSVLVVLFSFLELLVQLNDVGKGGFRMADAFAFVGLTLPKRMVDLMPVAALLGSTLALGLLADHQELAAMQAAGISVKRIAFSVLATSLLIMLAGVLVAEFIAPPLDQTARIRRSKAIYGKGLMLSKNGFWVRHGPAFVHVGKSFSGGRAADIEVYELDGSGRLGRFIFSRKAVVEGEKDWLLSGAEIKTFGPDEVRFEQVPEYRLESFLTPEQMAVLELPADSLSLSDLRSYIVSLEERGQSTETYALAFWQKICLPFSTGSMVLLSLTFIFGSTRLRNAGQRILAGMLVGILFYLANQIFGHLGVILNLPPLLMTLLPITAILAIAWRLLKRAF